MDYLKILKLPSETLMEVQRQLNLNLSQIGYIHAYLFHRTDNLTELAEYTGVPRSTLRDTKQSLIDAGLLDKDRGILPLLDAIQHARTVTHQGQNASNDLFSALTSYEQILVLDQFMCRVCNKTREANPGCKYSIRKVAEGENVFESRAVICSECAKRLDEEVVKENLEIWIRARRNWLEDREGTFLTDLEQDIISRIRSKNSDGVSPLTTPSTRKNFNNTNTELNSEPSVGRLFPSEKGGEPPGSPQVSGKKSKKSISSDDEEDVGGLESASEPTKHKPPKKKIGRKAELAKQRYEARVKHIEKTPPEEWTTMDLQLYFNEKIKKAFGFSSKGLSASEKNKHTDTILNGCADVEECLKFFDWVVVHWFEFWFADDKGPPTMRDIASRFEKLYGAFKDKGQARAIMAREGSVATHIEGDGVEIKTDFTPEQEKKREKSIQNLEKLEKELL